MGIVYGVKSIIGPGCVLNVKHFLKEIQDLEDAQRDAIVTNAEYARSINQLEAIAANKAAKDEDRINALNSRLCSADGKRHLYIDPKCKHTLNSLEKYCYKENTQVPDKDSGYDHMFDALSYAVDYLFPLRRQVALQPPQRWGQQITGSSRG